MATLDYLKRNVFPGESGGDYDALFGYSNRPGGQFAGVRLTDMTVNDALQFSAPSGPYGQWVKGQVGRVATPMGAYQAVGTTLRAAKEGLGLTGNERMTPELQDRIGMWIYQNQGPGAWEAWGGGGGGGNRATMSASGGPGMVGLMDFDEQPRGFGERLREGWRSGDLMDNLALAFNTMRMNPDQNIAQIVGKRQEQRGQQRTINRTAQWLMMQGREDLAQAMLSGALDPKSAAALALTPPEDARTALMKNYEYARDQGFEGSLQDFMKAGGGGGSVTTIDMSGGGKFEEQFARGDAERLGAIYDAGLTATRNMGRIDQLEALLNSAPQGGMGAIKAAAGEFGINTEGLSDIQAAQALINSLVPEQRQPGSGPMSDADLALFKQSLPRIINQPGGNQIILQTMRAIARYDAEAAGIVQMLRANEIDRPTAFRMLQERQNPLAEFKMPAATPGPAAPGSPESVLTPEDYDFLR